MNRRQLVPSRAGRVDCRSSEDHSGQKHAIAAYWPIAPGLGPPRVTATRVVRGAISLSSSNNFVLMRYSTDMKPVALPPGRAKLATRPPATGSIGPAKTIGIVRVSCSNVPTIEPLVARIVSGPSASTSAASLRMRSGSFWLPQRKSICTFLPTVQPSSANPLQEPGNANL
jgi:hypothetical protein